jgi:hypothetical protein
MLPLWEVSCGYPFLLYYDHPQQENKTLPLNAHEQIEKKMKENDMAYNLLLQCFTVSPYFTTWRLAYSSHLSAI